MKFEDMEIWKRSAKLSVDLYKHFIRFLQYSKGSCGELRTQIYIGMDIGYISQDKGKDWIEETSQLSAMMVGFINSIKKQLEVNS
jgi:four helix bundle protein